MQSGRKAVDPNSRFWPKIRIGSHQECWLWLGGKDQIGYGVFAWITTPQPIVERAHRVMWRLIVGNIPEGKSILHQCDVPACVNPGHLFLGTQAENMADAARKGRISRHARKLTAKIVLAIRASKADARSLAKRYGTTISNISTIRTRRSWIDLNPEDNYGTVCTRA